MAHAHAPSLQQDRLYIGPVAARLGIPALLVGIIALAVAAWIGLTSTDELMKGHFWHSYLAAFSFFLVISLGSMIFVLIQYLARAAWSVTVRRLAEGMSLNIFLMLLLILPLLGQVHLLYEWMDDNARNSDHILHDKSGYLNPTFFWIRLVAYFVIWCTTAAFYASRSAAQDKAGNPRTTVFLERLAMPLIILFGFSLTGFAFDWIMSLNPHWFSTIFGVYVFAGAMLSTFSSIVLLSLLLKKRGLLGDAVNHEHYHDLGKWMFAFTFFWGYIAFAQYMLIWYANMPEETQFFTPREIGGWCVVSLILLLVHLVIPFPGLLSRHVKRKNSVIAFWAVWQLCACALDIYWLVVPSQWIKRIPEEVGMPGKPLAEAVAKIVASNHNIYAVSEAHQDFLRNINFPFQAQSVLVTALCFVGIAGLFVFGTMMAIRGKSLVPLKDPRLPEALSFENI